MTFIGDGAIRHSMTSPARLGTPPSSSAAASLAGLIGQIAAEDPARAVLPHAIVPIYVRKSDAELARARRTVTP